LSLDSLLLITIPVIAALVGWLTNKLAVYMTFYPIEYVGKRPFGWQGIIPSKADKMATKAVTLVTTKLISVEEQFDKLDPNEIAKEMEPQLNVLSKSIIETAMKSDLPLVWNLMPERQKQQMYAETAAQFPKVISNLMSEVKQKLPELLDIDRMMIEGLTEDPEMLNHIFLKCGEEEFKFIEKSGLYFGFLFGVVQMIIWNYFQFWWLLPAGGLVVGYLTNFLALKLIFRPVEPVKIGPIKIQGLFMKRQNEVAEEYAKILAGNLLTAKQILNFIIDTNGIQKIADICYTQVDQMVDNTTGSTRKMLLQLAIGKDKYQRIKRRAAEMLIAALPTSLTGIFDYADEALEIEHTLSSKLKSLSKLEFEDVLHPIFKEDETTLIIVGAVLGGIAGVIQMAFML
jgi:uncharacterized membrane protein YheB (UPF0754 family)